MAIGSVTGVQTPSSQSTVSWDDITGKPETDINLNIKGAPADAKAVGDELAKRLLKAGGRMTGALEFGAASESIYSNGNDFANGPGGDLNNLIISSWNGISFTSSQEASNYYGKTAVGIDCRNGTIKAVLLEGNLSDKDGSHPVWFNLNANRLSPENEYWLCAHTNDYSNGFEIRDISLADLKTNIIAAAVGAVVNTGVASSGSNYVRFSDGTQICWDGDVWVTCGSDPGTFSFPQAFASSNYGITFINCTHSGNEKIVRYANRYTTYCEVSCSGGGTVELSYIAVGRWK